MPAGYSRKLLIDKLGIKEGMRVAILNPPTNYPETLGPLPAKAMAIKKLGPGTDFIQFFTSSRRELEKEFPRLKRALAQSGMVWISWPKGASKVATDLNENIVRDTGLALGLVDVKVCAVDETWSGLKFVYRLKDRK